MSNIKLVSVSPKPIIRVSGAVPLFIKKLLSQIWANKLLFAGLGISAAVVGFSVKYSKKKKVSRRPAIVNHNDVPRHRKNKPLMIRSPSGEIHSFGASPTVGQSQSSVAGSTCDESNGFATLLTTKSENGSGLTPQQYGLMGLESLEGSITLWEEALSSYTCSSNPSGNALPTQEEADFTQCLQKVIDEAYNLQETCEQLFLHQQSILFRSFEPTPESSEADVFERRTITSISSLDSFVSAQADIADLTDFEDFEDSPPPLYIAAMKHHEQTGIPYRMMRTEWCHCENDVDYLCKVHCLRLACHVIFGKKENQEWFAAAGRKIIDCLLIKNNKDPSDAIAAYDELLLYIETCDWVKVEKELQQRDVRALTFYDVVLDFILMDAFDDLENPPKAAMAVIQNRFLSKGFKESALSTAVWGILKRKRQLLTERDGLIAHFYDVIEHISPTLAWGFLGTDFIYRETCVFFRDQIQALVRDMFNYHVVHYTTVFHLSDDLVALAKERYKVLMDKLAPSPLVNGSVMCDSSPHSNGN